ncbi:MAG: transglycosylase SLT domain-containing protein [Nitrosomonadales bacterium]|nr:transglycosylase SLT domain-containing protein [Nitrosomonadales bacterium]
MSRAVQLEQESTEIDAAWQAADAYCEASRLGSTEAQYRLGMLYAFGRGVPESRPLAASLFSVAASQGHLEAQNMLETIALKTNALPECVLADVRPEKGPELIAALDASIEKRLHALPAKKRWLVTLVNTLSGWYEVDPKLVLSIMAVESNFELKATSHKSAMGLMQLIPDTAERFNVKDAYDATQNIRGGLSYMRWLLAYFEGDVILVVAAYNAGEGAVNRHKGIPPYAETRQYVQRVMGLYQRKRHPYNINITAPSPILKKAKPA